MGRVSFSQDHFQPGMTMTLSTLYHASDTALTARETEILDFIARGFTSKQIARQLNISPYTVNTHRDNLRRKLGAHNGAQLASFRATLHGGEATQAAMCPSTISCRSTCCGARVSMLGMGRTRPAASWKRGLPGVMPALAGRRHRGPAERPHAAARVTPPAPPAAGVRRAGPFLAGCAGRGSAGSSRP